MSSAVTALKGVLQTATRTSSLRKAALSIGVVNVTKRCYHENIVEHYENPRNVGSLDKKDDAVGTVSLTWFGN